MLLGILPAKWSYLAILPLLLVAKNIKKIRIDKVSIAILIFSMVIIVSGLLNRSTFQEIILFLRHAIYIYLIYFLVTFYITSNNIEKIIRLAMFIGIIQLPVLLIQRLFYDKLIEYSVISIGETDFMVGTFLVKNDVGLCVFLLNLIIFLLFEINVNYFIKKRLFLSVYFSFCILLTNSKLSYLILCLIWGVYLIKNTSLINIIKVSTCFIVLLLLTLHFEYYENIKYVVSSSWETTTLRTTVAENVFLKGGYSRAAGIQYFLHQPLKIFGDGPTKYTDRYGEKILGLHGHLLTFYAEIGIIGLLMSYIVFFVIGKQKSSKDSKTYILYFAVISIMTLTAFPTVHFGMLLSFFIMSSASLKLNMQNQTR